MGGQTGGFQGNRGQGDEGRVLQGIEAQHPRHGRVAQPGQERARPLRLVVLRTQLARSGDEGREVGGLGSLHLIEHVVVGGEDLPVDEKRGEASSGRASSEELPERRAVVEAVGEHAPAFGIAQAQGGHLRKELEEGRRHLRVHSRPRSYEVGDQGGGERGRSQARPQTAAPHREGKEKGGEREEARLQEATGHEAADRVEAGGIDGRPGGEARSAQAQSERQAEAEPPEQDRCPDHAVPCLATEQSVGAPARDERDPEVGKEQRLAREAHPAQEGQPCQCGGQATPGPERVPQAQEARSEDDPTVTDPHSDPGEDESQGADMEAQEVGQPLAEEAPPPPGLHGKRERAEEVGDQGLEQNQRVDGVAQGDVGGEARAANGVTHDPEGERDGDPGQPDPERPREGEAPDSVGARPGRDPEREPEQDRLGHELHREGGQRGGHGEGRQHRRPSPAPRRPAQ